MKKTKQIVMLTALVLFFMISLQASFAAEISISTSTTGGISTALSSASNDDTIILNPGTYSGTSNSGITIDKNITIKGNGSADAVIISGSSVRQIFAIDSGYTVTFINITFTSGAGNNNMGGAIYNDGTLTINGCKFTENSARYYGGAIYNDGDLTITDSTFTENIAIDDHGGAIYNNGDLTITDSTFTENSARYYGGAIYSVGSSANFDGCIFIKNSADDGSAIHTNNPTTLTGCTFTENTATYDGTLKGINGILLTVNNCDFIENTARAGAAIWVDGRVNADSCTFTKNTASERGGAIYREGTGSSTIKNCAFTNNTATHGGAIRSEGGTLTLTECDFIQNKATNQGGALSGIATINANNCTFIKNSAIMLGGAIYGEGSNILRDCNFTENTATDGGAIYTLTSFDASNCNFIKNVASGQGGAIRIIYYSSNNLNGCNFTENTATDGGAIYITDYDSALTANDCVFTENLATNNGGAIYNDGKSTLTGCTFIKNIATVNGGALYHTGYTGTVSSVSSSVFYKNTPKTIYVEGGNTLTLRDNFYFVVQSVLPIDDHINDITKIGTYYFMIVDKTISGNQLNLAYILSFINLAGNPVNPDTTNLNSNLEILLKQNNGIVTFDFTQAQNPSIAFNGLDEIGLYYNDEMFYRIDLPVDFTAFDAIVAEANALVSSDYNSISWNTYVTSPALSTVNNLDKLTATQAQTNAAVAALRTAIDSLLPNPADFTALDALVVDASNLNQPSYNATSWATQKPLIDNAVADANALNRATAKQSQVNEVFNALQTAMNGLIPLPPADFSVLDQLVNQANLLAQSNYTTTSWSIQKTLIDVALTSANALSRATATQISVDTIANALEAALDALVFDKTTELTALIASIDALNQADYTPATWTTLQTALAIAKGLTPGDITQANVDALQAAKTGLIPIDPNVILQGVINSVGSLNQADYTSTSWAALQAALLVAQAIAPGTATQADVNALQTAINALVFDKTAELNALIASINALNQADYTAPSWTTLQTALAIAKGLTPGDITQANVDALQAAKTGLVLIDPNIVIQGLITNIPVNNPGYTAASWAALQAALLVAQAIAPGTATQADVNALQTAINALVFDKTTELNALIATIPANNPGYTTSTWTALQAALGVAQAIAPGTATQADVDALQNALDALVLDKTTELNALIATIPANNPGYTTSTWTALQAALGVAQGLTAAEVIQSNVAALEAVVNGLAADKTTELKTLITTAKAIANADYTAASWAALQAAIAAAEGLTDGDISAANVAALQSAIDGLTKQAPAAPALDYNGLILAISAASVLDASKYTAASWNTLQSALNSAIAMNNARNAGSQADVDSLANVLNAARNNLVLATQVPTTPGPSNPPVGEKPGTNGTSNNTTIKTTPKAKADLKITKVKRSGNSYKITIKNIGKVKAVKSMLAIMCPCGDFVKYANVKALAAGKSVTITVKFFKYSMTKKHNKQIRVNYDKVVSESNTKNNLYKIAKVR